MNDITTLPLPSIRARTLGTVSFPFDFRGVILNTIPGTNNGWSAPWVATPKDLVGACGASQYQGVAIYAMQANLPASLQTVGIELEINGLVSPLTLLNTGREAVFYICSWWDGDIARFGTLADYLNFTCLFLPATAPPVRTGNFLLADHLMIDDTDQSASWAYRYLASMGVNVACLSSNQPSVAAPLLARRGMKLGWICRQGQDDAPSMGSTVTPQMWATRLVKSFTNAKWPLDKIALVIVSDEPGMYNSTDPTDADRMAAHMADCMAALRALIGPDAMLCFNANNGSLRSISPDGQVAIDPFTFSRLTKDDPNIILWSEDWMGDEGSELIIWPFLSSVAQSAGKQWGGYIVGQTAGDHYGDRIRSMVSRGASVCFNYHAGPNFRINDSYWAKRELVWNQVGSVFNGVG